MLSGNTQNIITMNGFINRWTGSSNLSMRLMTILKFNVLNDLADYSSRITDWLLKRSRGASTLESEAKVVCVL